MKSMTTLALNHLIQGTPAFLLRLGRSVSAFLEGIGEARAMAEKFKTLSRMTDAELARYGIRRDQIPQAVMAGRRRW
jgi:uncharacterized protein YjiS (DUF1127 family)